MLRKNEKLITIARLGSEPEALEVQKELESHDIQAVIMGNNLWTSFPNMRPKQSEIIIQILENDLEKAKRILNEKESQQGDA